MADDLKIFTTPLLRAMLMLPEVRRNPKQAQRIRGELRRRERAMRRG